jgi:hypothetical protein
VLAALGAIASWRTAQDEGRLREAQQRIGGSPDLGHEGAPGLAAESGYRAFGLTREIRSFTPSMASAIKIARSVPSKSAAQISIMPLSPDS